MSALAIAGVTAVLKNLTQNWLGSATVTASLGATPTVSALPPDQAQNIHDGSDGINWFLHRTAPNVGLSNEFLPVRNSSGNKINRAPLAIDLYYLLSAYGVSDMHAEVMLGYTLLLFNENPIIGRDAITAALANAASPSDATVITALNTASIGDYIEQIRLSIQYPDDEWLSKLWGALNANFRPSVLFHVSVVLIESDIAFQPGLPVQRYAVDALPLTLPRIDRIDSASNALALISFGDDIVIRGSNLRDDVTRVQIGDIELDTTDFTDVSNTAIEIPASAISGLSAGVTAVQVIHDLLLGIPAVPHRGFQSNVIALILHPTVSNITPNLTLTSGELDGTIQVDIQPDIERDQRVSLLLNDSAPTSNIGYSFSAAPRPNDSPVSSITFDVDGIIPSSYFIRVQVDGASSQLSVDPITRTIDQAPIVLN